MHRIVLITYPGFELLDLSGPAAVFNNANRTLVERETPPFYGLVLASAAGGPVESSSGIVVETRPLGEVAQDSEMTPLIVGAEREPLLAAMTDMALRAELAPLIERAARFGSVCSGGFVLAAMGLLQGVRVATHWDSCAPLTAAFPGVTVDADALYVVDGRCWTSAGVTTGIDMALAMVAADLDAGIAGEVAKRLVLYARRPGYQSQFSPILQAQIKGDSPFADLIAWMQANLAAVLDVPTLAERAGLSERSFHRKFTAATGSTPARFVETARLDMARLLLSRGVPLKSVAAEVGLSPAARLSAAFERRFGVSPRLYGDLHGEI
jgi:transcriptional regulator GlxA family with amidase domain